MDKILRLYRWSETNPMRVHTLLFAIRDIVYGAMVIWGVPDVKHSSLYQDLAMWRAVIPFGLAMMAVGVIAGVGSVLRHSRVTSVSLGISAWLWSFVTMSFLLSGNPAAGMMFLFGFAMTTGYLGYRYKWSRRNGVDFNPHGEYKEAS